MVRMQWNTQNTLFIEKTLEKYSSANRKIQDKFWKWFYSNNTKPHIFLMKYTILRENYILNIL